MDNIRKIRNIESLYYVLLILNIIAFVVLLVIGKLDITLVVSLIISIISFAIMAALLNAIAGGLEDALEQRTVTKEEREVLDNYSDHR